MICSLLGLLSACTRPDVGALEGTEAPDDEGYPPPIASIELEPASDLDSADYPQPGAAPTEMGDVDGALTKLEAGGANPRGRTQYLPYVLHANALPRVAGSPPVDAAVEPDPNAAAKPQRNAAATCPGIAIRQGDALVIDGRPFTFFGINARFLMDQEFPEAEVEPILASLRERGVGRRGRR